MGRSYRAGTKADGLLWDDFVWSEGPEMGANQFHRFDMDPGVVWDHGQLWVQAAWWRKVGPDKWDISWRRLAGPDIDHLVFVGNAALDHTFTDAAQKLVGLDTWWPSGIWRDPEDGTWYSPVHVEYEMVYGASFAHTRKISLARSSDHGASWSLVGDIVTADRDRLGSPGADWLDFGVGDQRLFVDELGKYFYLYYVDGWMRKSRYGLAGLTVKVCRCPINDRMAPGKWRKWFNGTWSEDALGGHDSALWPMHHGVYGGEPIVFFNTYLERYIACARDWIATASDLTTQDWSQPDYAGFGRQLWYTWTFDTLTRSRYTIGQEFRLYTSRTSDIARYTPVTLRRSTRLRRRRPNMLVNPGFESGDIAPWTSHGAVAVVTENVMSGLRALKLCGESRVAQVVTGLAPQTHYSLSAWIFVSDGQARLGVTGGPERVIDSRVNRGYHSESTIDPPPAVEFTVSADQDFAEVYIELDDRDAVVYADDFRLISIAHDVHPKRARPPVADRDGSRGGRTASEIEPSARWNMDDGAPDLSEVSTVQDVTGNANDGVLEGHATWARGIVGGSIRLPSPDDRVTIRLERLPSLGSSWTLTTWMQLGADFRGHLLAFGTADNPRTVAVDIDAGRIGLRDITGDLIVSTPASAGWHHYAFALDSSKTTLYIDGVQEDSSKSNPTHDLVPQTLILTGATIEPGQPGVEVGETRIYAKALTSSEIAGLSVRGGLRAHWRMGEGAGGLLADATGNGNTCRLASTEWVPRRKTAALRFDGRYSQGVVEAPAIPELDAPKTISWWMRQHRQRAAGPVLSLSALDRGPALTCETMPNGQLRVYAPRLQLATDLPGTGAWHHLAYSFDGRTHALYRDAQLVVTSDMSCPTGPVDRLFFGRDAHGASHFAGDLHDVRIHSRHLSVAEIRFLWLHKG